MYYLLSKEVCSFSAPTVFRGALNVGGNLQSYGTNNFYGNNTFFTNTHFADGITVDGSFNQIIYDETGNVFINSSTTATSQKNASLLINNQANPVNTTPGFDTMASMLVFTTATSIDTQSKSSLPSYVNELQFSISGENVSVGHGFGDSSFNVFGNSVMDGNLSIGIGNSSPTTALDVSGNMLLHNGSNMFLGSDNSSNTTGGNNTGIGIGALEANTIGVLNTALGIHALQYNIDGSSNTAVGCYAMLSNTNGLNNTALGVSALYANTIGFDNTAIGLNALQQNISGGWNTAIGLNAMRLNTTGSSNIALGVQALEANTIGVLNTALGIHALQYNISGGSNVAVGNNALNLNTYGLNNTAVGNNALYSNEGYTGYAPTAGVNNTAVGYKTLFSNKGYDNTAVGFQALYNVSSGNNNTAIGYTAGYSNIIGSTNTYLGYSADCSGNSNASNSTAIGFQANITKSDQIVLGQEKNGIYGPYIAPDVYIPGNLGISTAYYIRITGLYNQSLYYYCRY